MAMVHVFAVHLLITSTYLEPERLKPSTPSHAHRLHYPCLVITLISSDVVSGSAFKLQPTQDYIQFAGTGEADCNKGRSLRAQTKTNEAINQDDEERLTVAGLANKLGTGVKTWAKNKQLEMHLKKMALFSTNPDDTAQKLLQEGVTPDKFHKTLKLEKDKNAYLSLNIWSSKYAVPTAEYELWMSLKKAWERVHLNAM